VGIELQCAPLSESNHEPWPLSLEGEIIGRITRCAHSPRLNKNIGFANVPIEQANPGMSLIVSTPAGEQEAIVVKAPWFPAQK